MNKIFKKYRVLSTIFLILTIIFLSSCKKDWLDAKPDKALVVPKSIQDYQALLDNSTNLFNFQGPAIQEVASDDYFLTTSRWQSQEDYLRNVYTWNSNPYQGIALGDWQYAYNRILNSNIVLEGIENLPSKEFPAAWNNVKGSALFYRAFDFYSLAQLFCKPYIQSTATTDLGIPLRLTADLNDEIARASVQQTYDQIINDLKIARHLLPVAPLYKTRPSLPAVYGLLARTYLAMENYTNAILYSDSCLQLSNSLLDFNTDLTTLTFPMPRFDINKEVIFHFELANYFPLFTSQLIVDSTLYQSYGANDLRKTKYFRLRQGFITFYGRYTANQPPFGGIATDEMFLIRGECFARAGNTANAMNDLNTLLIKRWSTGTFIPYTAVDANDALVKILQERRKELCFRGLRWTDLRRLNHDPVFAKTLTRIVDGQTYTLSPNDLRYVFLIPDDEIKLSGIQQNPR